MKKPRVLDINEVTAKVVPWGTTKVLIDSENVGASGLEVRYTEMLPGQVHQLHAHDVQEILFVLSGKGSHIDEEQQLTIESGNVIYVPAGAKHRHECIGNQPLKFLVIFSGSKPNV